MKFPPLQIYIHQTLDEYTFARYVRKCVYIQFLSCVGVMAFITQYISFDILRPLLSYHDIYWKLTHLSSPGVPCEPPPPRQPPTKLTIEL